MRCARHADGMNPHKLYAILLTLFCCHTYEHFLFHSDVIGIDFCYLFNWSWHFQQAGHMLSVLFTYQKSDLEMSPPWNQ